MTVQRVAVANLPQLAALLHRPIPRELTLGRRPRLLGRVPSGQRIIWRHVPGDLRGDAQPDAAATHFLERHRSAAAIGFVRQTAFALANLVDRPREIAVPLERVHRQIQVRVEDQQAIHADLNTQTKFPMSTAPMVIQYITPIADPANAVRSLDPPNTCFNAT